MNEMLLFGCFEIISKSGSQSACPRSIGSAVWQACPTCLELLPGRLAQPAWQHNRRRRPLSRSKSDPENVKLNPNCAKYSHVTCQKRLRKLRLQFRFCSRPPSTGPHKCFLQTMLRPSGPHCGAAHVSVGRPLTQATLIQTLPYPPATHRETTTPTADPPHYTTNHNRPTF